jgi:hypothetical protein
MKNYILMYCAFLSFYIIAPIDVICKTTSKKDSLTYWNLDSTYEEIYSLFQTFILDQINTPIISPISHSTSKLLASWPNISSWGNKKRKHGRYRENEMNETGPYFLFDRYTDGHLDDYLKLNNKLQSVRDQIIDRGSAI